MIHNNTLKTKQDIFDNYVELGFKEPEQAEFKKEFIKYNYSKFFPKDTNAKILDIGVGRGEMLSVLKEFGYDYSGIDISESCVSFCQSLNLNCSLVEDTIEYLKTHPKEYDMITFLDVIEHIEKSKLIEFMQAIRNATKENGSVIIQAPNALSPDSIISLYNDFTHEILFTENSLFQLLTTAGFKDVKYYAFEDIVGSGIKYYLRLLARSLYLNTVKLKRFSNNTLNSDIMTNIIFAIAKK